MAEQNAWQFHRMDGVKMDHLAFRRSVVVRLLETNKKKKTKKRGPVRPSGQMYDHARFDHLDHFVTFQEQTRCGFRHKKVQFRFQKWNVALHPKYCIVAYHEK
jgi:hypothetical protein